MLENANRDIHASIRGEALRQNKARRLDEVVRAIDDLLFQLEDLNLQGVDRVPARLRERAGAILRVVPDAPADHDFRIRYRVVPMMDVLFRAQEIIFRKRDPDRPIEDDEELLA